MVGEYSFMVVVDFVTSNIAPDLEGWKIPVSPLCFTHHSGVGLLLANYIPETNLLV